MSHHCPSLPKHSKPSSTLLSINVGDIDSSSSGDSGDDMLDLSSSLSSLIQSCGVRCGTLADFGMDGNGVFNQNGKILYNHHSLQNVFLVLNSISF